MSKTFKNVVLVLLGIVILGLLIHFISNSVYNTRIKSYEDRVESLLDSILIQESHIQTLREDLKISEMKVMIFDSLLMRKSAEYEELKKSYKSQLNKIESLPTDEAIEYLRNQLDKN